MKSWVEDKHPIDPNTWIDSAAKLNILVSDDQAILFNLQQEVAKKKVELIEFGDSVAKAKVKVEAMDEYRQMKLQEAKIEGIIEQIRIAKIQARMSQMEYNSN